MSGLIDPWNMQADLMVRSSQRVLPPSPGVFHAGVLSYLALFLEEGAELVGALEEMSMELPVPDTEAERRLVDLAHSLVDVMNAAGSVMLRASKDIRRAVEGAGRGTDLASINMPRAQAILVIDGATDAVVTLAGLTITAGLPGAEAYEVVYRSNRSKANADGVIAIDPTGKWIKGENYHAPDLAALLNSKETK